MLMPMQRPLLLLLMVVLLLLRLWLLLMVVLLLLRLLRLRLRLMLELVLMPGLMLRRLFADSNSSSAFCFAADPYCFGSRGF